MKNEDKRFCNNVFEMEKVFFFQYWLVGCSSSLIHKFLVQFKWLTLVICTNLQPTFPSSMWNFFFLLKFMSTERTVLGKWLVLAFLGYVMFDLCIICVLIVPVHNTCCLLFLSRQSILVWTALSCNIFREQFNFSVFLLWTVWMLILMSR